jgi:hypothetical protein
MFASIDPHFDKNKTNKREINERNSSYYTSIIEWKVL